MSQNKKSLSPKAARQPQDRLPESRQTITNKEQMFPFDDEKERLLSLEDQDNLKSTAMESNTNSDKLSGSRPGSDQNEVDPNAKNYRKTSVRWCMLAMACFYMVGSNFCYDNPGPLQTQLEDQLNLDATQFSLLYTVYSLPNMILPLLGGILLDSIGVRMGLIFFCAVLTAGQFIFMLGGYATSYNEMIAGRVVFGLGGESMQVAQSSIISLWFKGKEMAFALGLNLSIARLGSVVNGIIVPQVYDSSGLGTALAVGFVICLFSLLSAVGMAVLDRRAETKNKEDNRREGQNQQQEQSNEEDGFKMEYLYSFSTSFWLLTGSCVLTYMSVFPYIQNCSDLLQKKYGFDKVKAGYLFGVPYIISAIASPFLGAAIDRFGKRAFLICMSSVILIIGFGASMMMPECHQCYNEMYPLIFTGIGYSIYASAIWGSVPYVVKPQAVGTAFGLATTIQNIGLCAAPTIVGFIKDKTKSVDHGYFYMNVFFVGINIIGLILNFNLYYIDIKYNNGVLDKVDLVESETSSDFGDDQFKNRGGNINNREQINALETNSRGSQRSRKSQ